MMSKRSNLFLETDRPWFRWWDLQTDDAHLAQENWNARTVRLPPRPQIKDARGLQKNWNRKYPIFPCLHHTYSCTPAWTYRKLSKVPPESMPKCTMIKILHDSPRQLTFQPVKIWIEQWVTRVNSREKIMPGDLVSVQSRRFQLDKKIVWLA